MSNDDLNKSEDLDNDLEHVALNVERQESPFSEKEHEAAKSTAASEQDRSLANLHTGSGREYEEPAILSPEEGMRENDQVVEQKSEENQQKQAEAEAEQNFVREENVDFSFEQAETVSLNQSDFVVPQDETQLGDLLPPTERNQAEEENSQELQNESQEEAIVLDAKEKPETSADIASNEAPNSVVLDDNSVDENSAVGTVVGTVTADDPEGDTLSYSLSDDAGGMFTIDPNSGEIKVAGALDHEAQDSYSVTVDVFDGEHTTQQTFTIDVGDVNEAAHSVALDDNTVDENSAVGTVVGTVSADDPEGDTLSYSLSDDAGGMFTIDPNSGEIKVAGALDHEAQDSYSVTVDVFDGEHTTQQTFTIDVGDVNEAAHSVALDDNTVDENSAVGTVVGTVSADDPEGDTLSYSLSDDAGGMFTIDPNSGEIKVAGALDHEAQDSYSVTVDVFDGEHTTQQTFTIDVGDVNEAAHSVALDDNTVDENSAVGTVVGTVTADDPEGGTLSYSLSDDAGGMFTIDPSSGEIKVAGSLDHEAQDSYSVTVDVFDGEHTTQQTFTIDVGDVNEAAHSVALDDNTVDENSAVGTVVGTVSADDPEGDTLSYSLSDDAGGMFTIDPNSGEIKVAGALDHEAQDSYSVTVDVFDGEHTTQQTFTIDVGDVNEAAHSVALDDNAVDENSAVGTVVGTVTADDPEGDTLSYSLSDDAGGMFTIDPNSGEIKVAGALDHEAQDSYSVTVDVFDGEHTTQQTFTIDVGDVNEAAHSVALDDNAVDENSAVGTVVGTVTADDPEGDTLSYSLSDDAGGMFTIDPNSGEIKVAGALDHEAQDSYSVTVDVFDGEHTTQQTFTIDVGDVNEAAHSVALDDNSVDENSAVGTVVGTVTADDPEGDTLSYSLSDDAGGMFIIDPNSGEIKVAGALDHEAQDSYSVTVDVFDGEHTTQQTFTIDVGDLAAPTMTGSGNTIAHAEVDEVMDLSNMDHFPDLSGSTHLETSVGTEIFEDMVSDAEGLVINHQSDATMTFQGEIAGYRSSVGAYQVNEDGTVNNVQLMWGDASSDKLTQGVSTATYEGIEQGSQLGFFVISNGFSDLPDDAVSGDGNTISETGTWMFVSPDFDPATDTPSDHEYNVNTDSGPPQLIYVEGDGTIHTQDGNVFHSLYQTEFNPEADIEDREHFIAGVDQDNGILHMGFEDMMGGGDGDFNDGMFSVEIDVRDLVETPNPLFAQDEFGRSSFEITDSDSADLTDATVVVGNIQTGDSLTVAGGYELDGGLVKLTDGSTTGISYSLVEDGGEITVSFSGTGSVDLYESIIQSINFSNDGSGGDAAGDRTIEVSVTDSSGEASEVLSTSIRVATNSDTYTATANSDEYYGDGSDETIEGAGGDDYLHGGSGDDVLYGGAGDDEVYGGDGSDIFYFASDEGNDEFYGGEGSGWSDTIVLTDGMPAGDVSDWLTLTSGSIESTASGEIFLSEDAAGTISLDGGNAVLTFEGVEKIEA